MASNYQVPPYLKRDGEALVFNKPNQQFLFYVPEKFFTTKNAEIVGEYVTLLGLIDFCIVDMNGKVVKPMKLFKFPSVFTTKPSSIEKVKEMTLTKYAKPQDYRILRYNKGDKIVVSVSVPQNIETVEAFYGLFIRGNLPPTIPYDKLVNIYIQNMALSGNKYGINAQIFGLLYSEVYRAYDDIRTPYIQSGNKDPLAYKAITLADVPKMTSAYQSLTSENWDNSVVGAIQTKNDKDSPLEPILTGE